MARARSEHAPRRTARTAAALCAATLAAASIALIAPSAGAAPTKTTKNGVLTVESPGVTVLTKGANQFAKAKNNQSVKTGDTVQTDPTGYAQIKFPDGSLTRLDHDTVFTLEKLSSKTGDRQIESKVSAGQTWNRVQKLETGEFKQEGSGATAAVLGTSFVTKCSMPANAQFKKVKTRKQLLALQKQSMCKFTLIDGKLQLTSVNGVLGITRGQAVDIGAGGVAGAAQTLPPDILFTDAWIVRNLGLDTKAGVSEAIGTATDEDLRQARIVGTWPVNLTVVANNGFRDLAPSRTRSYTVAGSCTGNTCAVTLTRDTANGPRTIPLTYTNGVYSGQDPDLGTQNCVLDNGAVSVVNGLRNSSTISFTPTAASPDNGLWRATALSGTVTETAVQIAGTPTDCRTATATFALAANR